MARQPVSLSPNVQETIYIITGADGEQLAEIPMREEVALVNGSMTSRKTHQYMELEDGNAIHPFMLMGPNAVKLSVCPFCRKRPSWLHHHPSPARALFVQDNVRCASCHKPLCPRHRHQQGKVFRCKRCARRHALKSVFKACFVWLFFTEE